MNKTRNKSITDVDACEVNERWKLSNSAANSSTKFPTTEGVHRPPSPCSALHTLNGLRPFLRRPRALPPTPPAHFRTANYTNDAVTTTAATGLLRWFPNPRGSTTQMGRTSLTQYTEFKKTIIMRKKKIKSTYPKFVSV